MLKTNDCLMKRLTIILFTLLASFSLSAQNLQDLVYDMDYDVFRVGVDYRNDCLLNKHFNNDTLFITLFTQLPTDRLRWSVYFTDDTLLFDIGPDNTIEEAIKYDSTQKITTHSFTFKQQHCGFEVNYGYIINFKLFVGIKIPNIKLNNQQLEQVTDKVSYKLIGQDTINRIDYLGMRQGLWASFEENKLAAIDSFYNDRRISSYQYNSNGDIVSIIDEYGNQALFLKREIRKNRKIRKEVSKNPIIKKLIDNN